MQLWKVFALTLTLPAFWTPSRSLAQDQNPIIPALDGTNTQVDVDSEGNIFNIDGGTRAGSNLFHSFQHFGLNAGEIARFLSEPGIHNIFGRVVGGNPSIINGLIEANPNLYLMNPAGIVFGANAQLNVGGDFFATTANQICFDGGCFQANGLNNYAALLGNPTSLGFLQPQPGGLINAGVLAVDKGKSIHLSGGTVVNVGSITAHGGVATIAAIPGEQRVRLSQPGHLLSLEFTDDILTNGINPLSLPELLTTASESLATKAISAPLGNVALRGTVQAEQVDLNAAGQVTRSHDASVEGKTRVTRFSASGGNPDQAVFIDRRADNPEALLYGTAPGTVAQIIEREQDGIAFISAQLDQISKVMGKMASVALVAEGSEGNFWLGNQWLRAVNIADHAQVLQEWGTDLTTNADILLYSSFAGLDTTGTGFIENMAQLTGADVAASENATGSANYGADWHSERHTGPIEARNPFTIETLNNWQGNLTTYTVVSAQDSGFGSLREAIANAEVGDTITFAFSEPTTITLNKDINWFTNNITVDGSLPSGENLIISGGGTSRIFDIFTNNAELKNIHLTNGFSENKNGGAIRHLGQGELRISDSIISESTAGARGGGIHSLASVILLDSKITKNQGSNGAGGVFALKDIEIINSEISENTSLNAGGGVVGGNINIFHSIIAGNSSAESGGGIASWREVRINSSTIIDNLAGKDGGGMAIAGDVLLTNSIVSGNSAVGSGGGFSIGSGTATLTDTFFENNQAGSSQGLDILSEAANVEILKTGILNFTESIQFNDKNHNSGLFLSGEQVNIPNSLELDGIDLIIQATDSVDALELNSSSVTGGGDFYIAANNDIKLRNVITNGIHGAGGNVHIESIHGSVSNAHGGSVGFIGTSSNGGNAGNVTIRAATGITLGKVFAEGLGGNGGSVELASPGFIRIINAGPSFFNTKPASIAAAGTSAGGSIRIQHGGEGTTPFVVGDADVAMNGTADRVTVGNGIEQTIAPQQFFLHNHTQSSIQIRSTDAPPAPLSSPGSNLPLPQVNNPVTAQQFAERIGEQLGAMTHIMGEGTEQARVVWTIPGEDQPISIPISLPLIDITNIALGYIDEQLEGEYEAYFQTELDEDAETVNFTTIQEMLTTITAQTGTRPAVIYVLRHPTSDTLQLLLVTPQAEHISHRSVDVSPPTLKRMVHALNQRIQRPGNHSYRQSAQRLYDWLIRPLAQELATAQIDTLLFAMPEGLRTIPLAALHDGEQFLVEQYSLGLIPSISLTDSTYRPLHDRPTLAMGAEHFQGLPHLPAVPFELQAIAQTHPETQQYLNEAFTFENLRQASPSYDIVHLATHASIHPAYIQFWQEKIGFNQLRTLAWDAEHPLELMVLSACETALGKPDAELGFAGLAVGSGVKSALASLWQVSDGGTSALMQGFYQNLQVPTITIKAEALRQAQLALLRGEGQAQGLPAELQLRDDIDFTHPFYWSGFTLIGSPW